MLFPTLHTKSRSLSGADGRTRGAARLFLLILVSIPALTSGSETVDSSSHLLELGDSAYQMRAEGHQGTRALPGPIEESIDYFQAALERDPDNLQARWKLLRALYFKGEYVCSEKDEKLVVFSQAIEVADTGRAQLLSKVGYQGNEEGLSPEQIAAALEAEPDAAEIYFWSAAHWGLWGRYRGKIAAARQGVATRVRDYAEVTSLLDESLEEAGGHRILGRLHAEAPRLPFVTGWVDHNEAIRQLERAAEIDPDALLTKVFLAEALLEYRPQRRLEAIELLEVVASSSPDPGMLVEETKTIADARELLESLDS
jgi:tetratricopeptide (TPR) repeat protein